MRETAHADEDVSRKRKRDVKMNSFTYIEKWVRCDYGLCYWIYVVELDYEGVKEGGSGAVASEGFELRC
ncbi:hypothetical protein Tco_1396530, partial [Tanacetum coccineum]